MESLVRDNPAERLLTLDQRTVNGRVVIGVTPNEQRMLELAIPKIMADHKLNEADARRLASEYVQQHFRQPPTTLPNLSVFPGNRVQPNTTTLMISPEDLSASTTEVINRMVSHAALAEAIRQNGGRVEVLKGPDHQGSGIELWTRDSYLRVGNQILFPNNTTGEYSGKKDEDMRRDAAALTQFFGQRGIKTTQTDIPFQGGDMMVDEQRKIILYGMQPGGNREQYEQNAARLQQLTGYRTVVVERSGYRTQIGDAKDQTLYHLDLITSVLPNGRLMVFPPGLTARSMEDLRKIYGNNIVTIQNGEEQTAVANATYVGNVMIANQVPERLRAELLKQGIRVVSASDIGPNINFTFGQGSVHCLTNEIPTSTPSATPTSTPSRRADADKDRSGLRFSELQDYKATGTPSLPALPTASIAALPTEIITPSASTSSTPSSTPTAVPTSSPSGSPSSSPAASSSPTSTPTVAKKAAAIAAPGRTA
ncbi:MAG: hypothetical protein SFW65_05000 [Alphaproteobacteria bacterium]|nr:hypothetical protein [Alphaproteobacteria bacterium]